MKIPFAEWLKDVPTLAVAKERLALAQDEVRRLEGEVQRLREENLRLLARVESIRPAKFLEAHGVLWKRDPSGRIEPIAYCPKCELALSAFPPGSNEMLLCSSCDFTAPFRPKELLSRSNSVPST
jgi:hypothetical protein